MDWILVPNWGRFQHYKDRTPVWIKLYLELRDKDEWRHLTLAERGLLVSIWIEYGASRGVLRVSELPQRLLAKVPRRSIDSLVYAGFIVLSASKPLASPALARGVLRTPKESEAPNTANGAASLAEEELPRDADAAAKARALMEQLFGGDT